MPPRAGAFARACATFWSTELFAPATGAGTTLANSFALVQLRLLPGRGSGTLPSHVVFCRPLRQLRSLHRKVAGEPIQLEVQDFPPNGRLYPKHRLQAREIEPGI